MWTNERTLWVVRCDDVTNPSWISIFGLNFGVDQNFCTKFYTEMENQQPSAQKLDFRKSKMADGRHLGFRFWAIISASINIFAPNFTPR